MSLKQLHLEKNSFPPSVCCSCLFLGLKKQTNKEILSFFSQKVQHIPSKRNIFAPNDIQKKSWHDTTFTFSTPFFFFFFFFFLQNSFVVFCKIKKSPLGLKTVLFYSISVLCFCKLCKFRSRTSGVRKKRSGQFRTLQLYKKTSWIFFLETESHGVESCTDLSV